ncbi:MAG TPA: hypothetical protein VGX92_14115 [Pyrinomonadaceae bacterium]|jgi:phosphopantetheinyl transferase (holo-ACP synthase)|nr:hypothetical protein [Pyrinomonadaceae bacterium]
MAAVHLEIHHLPPAAAREELLSAAERAQLSSMGLGPRRRSEWISGRLAARRALCSRFGEAAATSLSLLVEPDGAPRLEGKEDYAVSLSHDGDYFAVAIAERAGMRVGVDVCLRKHEARLRRILPRLRLRGAGLDVFAQWAALECFLKVRRLGVAALLDTALTVEADARGAKVSADGCALLLTFLSHPDFVAAWGGELA